MLRPAVTRIAQDLADALRPEAVLVAGYAVPVPIAVTCVLLGVAAPTSPSSAPGPTPS